MLSAPFFVMETALSYRGREGREGRRSFGKRAFPQGVLCSMKVACWLVGEQTDMFAALGTVLAVKYKKQITIECNYVSSTTVQDYFEPGNALRVCAPRSQYCYEYGEAGYYRHLWDKEEYGRKSFRMQRLKGKINFIEPPESICPDKGDSFQDKNAMHLMCLKGYGKSVGSFLKNADKIVVFLSEKREDNDRFFICNESVKNNCSFIVTRREGKECPGALEITRRYGIPGDRVCEITGKHDFYYMSETDGVESVIINKLKSRGATRRGFVGQLISAANMILREESA